MTDQRRTQRFEMRLPLELVRTGSKRVSQSGETKNLGSGGVLFTSDAPVDVGELIEYLITLPSGLEGEVKLRCMGKVTRLEGLTGPRAVAATVERYEFVRLKA